MNSLDLDRELVVDLFTRMQRIRAAEMEVVRVYPEQEMRCPVHLHVGQEAVSAGVAAVLRSTDRVFGSHRSHGPYLALGGDLERFYRELYGREGGCCEGRGGSMHLIDRAVGFWGSSAIVAGTLPIAVGSAYSARYLGEDVVTACFFGDGAVDEGAFYECLNYAALEELPVLFVCENNFYATNSRQRARQRATDLVQRAEAFGVAATRVDGNDVEAVWQATARAVERARRGGGPYFLEAETYRWFAHVGPNPDDGPAGPRPREEADAWRARCPIALLRRRYPQHEGAFSRIEAALTAEVEVACAQAAAAPFPNVERFLAGGWR